jgi:flavodoxin II
MTSVCIYFGSSTGFTEMAAEKIYDEFSEGCCEIFNAVDDGLAVVERFPLIIFGIPTWDYGGLQEDWQARWSEIDSLQITGKYFAVFGMGDQLGYSAWYQDAMGELHGKLIQRGGLPIGYWPNEGHQFTHSRGLTNEGDFFVGLPLDDTNQNELSATRISEWCQQLINEFYEASGVDLLT